MPPRSRATVESNASGAFGRIPPMPVSMCSPASFARRPMSRQWAGFVASGSSESWRKMASSFCNAVYSISWASGQRIARRQYEFRPIGMGPVWPAPKTFRAATVARLEKRKFRRFKSGLPNPNVSRRRDQGGCYGEGLRPVAVQGICFLRTRFRAVRGSGRRGTR